MNEQKLKKEYEEFIKDFLEERAITGNNRPPMYQGYLVFFQEQVFRKWLDKDREFFVEIPFHTKKGQKLLAGCIAFLKDELARM